MCSTCGAPDHTNLECPLHHHISKASSNPQRQNTESTTGKGKDGAVPLLCAFSKTKENAAMRIANTGTLVQPAQAHTGFANAHKQ